MFVYPTEFESRGIFSDSVTKYSTLGLFLFQLMMFGLFVQIFGREFTICSIILLVGELITMITFRQFN